MIFCNINTSSLEPLGFAPFSITGFIAKRLLTAKSMVNILSCKSLGPREVRAQKQQDGVRARFPACLLPASTHLTNYRITFPQRVGRKKGLNKQENFHAAESARRDVMHPLSL